MASWLKQLIRFQRDKSFIIFTVMMLIAVSVFGWLATDALTTWTLKPTYQQLTDQAKTVATGFNAKEMEQLVEDAYLKKTSRFESIQNLLSHQVSANEIFKAAEFVHRANHRLYIAAATNEQRLGIPINKAFPKSTIAIQQVFQDGFDRQSEHDHPDLISIFTPVYNEDKSFSLGVLVLYADAGVLTHKRQQARVVGLGATVLLALFAIACVKLAYIRDDLKHEIAERKKYEMESHKLALVAEKTNNAVLISDNLGCIEWVNKAFENMTDRKLDEVIGKSPGEILHGPQTDIDTRKMMNEQFSRGKNFNTEALCYAKTGRKFWALIEVQMVEGEKKDALNYIAVLHDITKRKEQEAELIRKALYDPLTQLPNRSLFMQQLEETLDQPHHRRQEQYAVMFLDLDGFKQINDTLGHEAGDQTLVEFAKRLKDCTREDDTVARLAGDEFTILLRDVLTDEEVEVVAKRIIDSMAQPMELTEGIAHPTTSIGIALGQDNYTSADEVLSDADAAMYQAKNNGKNRYIIYQRDL